MSQETLLPYISAVSHSLLQLTEFHGHDTSWSIPDGSCFPTSLFKDDVYVDSLFDFSPVPLIRVPNPSGSKRTQVEHEGMSVVEET